MFATPKAVLFRFMFNGAQLGLAAEKLRQAWKSCFSAARSVKWWRLRNLSANFALKDFYAQTIENFVVAIPDMIESCRITEKVL